MNGDTPQSNKSIIFIVILTVAGCTVIGVATFALCMLLGLIIAIFHVVNHHELPPMQDLQPAVIVVSAFGSIITACLGYLAGVLSRTTPTEMTKHVEMTTGPTLTDADTAKPPPLPPKL